MPEIMPFGKMKDKSVEQILLQDYSYFVYIMDNIPIKKPSLRQRFDFVEHVANNFKSKKSCVRCSNPAKYVSIYRNWYMGSQSSSLAYIYCSSECWQNDPTGAEPNKISLEPLKFRTALSDTKCDTNELVKMLQECMGLKSGRKTREYLEEFFNSCELWTPYTHRW